MWKKIQVWLIPALLFIFAACSTKQQADSGQQEKKPPPLVQKSAQKAPLFSLQNADGQTINAAEFKGKVLILDFWATWCPPCREEIPHFIELQNQYGAQGLQVVGISVDQQGWSVVKPFIQANGINYPILMYTEDVYRDYQELIEPAMRGGIPFTFIIDRQGNVREKFVGYRDKSVFESAIKPLLEG